MLGGRNIAKYLYNCRKGVVLICSSETRVIFTLFNLTVGFIYKLIAGDTAEIADYPHVR